MNQSVAAALVCLLFASALSPRIALAEPTSQVSAEDAKAAFEKKEYNDTLRIVARLLSLKGKAADGLDRYELLMLRAESHLQLKATTTSLSSLEEAAKVAKAQNEDKRVAEANALATLIKRSKGLQYTPKIPIERGAEKAVDEGAEKGAEKPATKPAEKASEKKKSFDLLDLSQRKDALAALYADDKVAIRPKILAAAKAKTIQPLAAAMEDVVPLKELEIASTGSDKETAELIKALVEQTHGMLAKATDEMTRQTERISVRANEVIQELITRANGSTDYRSRRAGLLREDSQGLKTTITECKKVIDTAQRLAKQFEDQARPFEDLEDQARETGERAYKVLNDNYSRLRG